MRLLTFHHSSTKIYMWKKILQPGETTISTIDLKVPPSTACCPRAKTSSALARPASKDEFIIFTSNGKTKKNTHLKVWG